MIRTRLTSAVLTVIVLAAATGIGAHHHEGSCPSNLPDCCKKAQSNEQGASMARVCCNLNCSDPGSTGSSSSASLRLPQSESVHTVVAGAAPFNSKIIFAPDPQPFYPSDPSPRYIKHLALLI